MRGRDGRTRFSISDLMLVVVPVAIDCLAIRILQGRTETSIELMLYGGLPMANILAIGFHIMVRRRKPRPFLVGFELAGWSCLLIYVACSLVFPDWLNDGISLALDPVFGALSWIGGVREEAIVLWLHLAIAVATMTAYLLAPALIFGWLAKRYRIRVTIERRDQESGAYSTSTAQAT